MSFAKTLARAAALLLIASTPLGAETIWPTKPVTIIVPFAAGGTTDSAARLIAEEMGRSFDHRVIVENRTGASGTIGASYVASAAADGYTLLLATQTTQGSSKSLIKGLRYDPEKDFTAISELLTAQIAIAVHPSLQVKTIPELVSYLKTHPREVNYGSGGIGSFSHITAALFAAKAGVDMQHIPFQGDGPAMIALLGGTVQVMFSTMVGIAPFIGGDKLDIVGVVGPERVAALPDKAALTDVLPDYYVPNFLGLMAPKGLADDVLERIAKVAIESVNKPQLRERLALLGFDPVGSSPAAFAKKIARDLEMWPEIIRQAGLTAQ